MLKNIALSLFAVVMGMSWIILVKDKEIEYSTTAKIYIENSNFFEENDDDHFLEYDYLLDQEYADEQESISL
ncbi:hypothetical protein [Acinetobacter equi]|uniref:Uncharacterized protein n=1 Tax=Acinetobacter equi TaxID=1324350 RepID=A0A0N7GXX4_9GAMM|nr:hypothetical protein [Acinetobacter equi]ALH95923.1 hypothetical protein AOY20_10480 [Acinetobacter equi]